MSKYENLRGDLISALGGRCERCNVDTDLEFDHPRGRNWEPNRLSKLQRLARYARDAMAGDLRILCCACNKADGGRARWAEARKLGRAKVNPFEVVPF